MRKIEQALTFVVPQFKNLAEVVDKEGIPHLEAAYTHWRSKGTRQREDQFSDGTLRLIALLWSLLEGEGLLLLEEPELSLNAAIIRALPALIYRLLRKRKGVARIEPSDDYYYPSVVPLRRPTRERQVVISTHSVDLLSDKGIGGEEVLLLKPTPEGTEVKVASEIQEVRDLLEGGLSVADAVMARIEPPDGRRLGCSMRKIGINLVFEDELHAAVLEKIVTASQKYSAGAWVRYGGSGEIRKKIKSYNYSARGMAYLVLTDLDQGECAPGLIEDWLENRRKHPNLLFRVAVHQVEAWLLASRREFAHFAKVKEHLIPEKPDDLENSKKFLIQLVNGSEDPDLRADIVPEEKARPRSVGTIIADLASS